MSSAGAPLCELRSLRVTTPPGRSRLGKCTLEGPSDKLFELLVEPLSGFVDIDGVRHTIIVLSAGNEVAEAMIGSLD